MADTFPNSGLDRATGTSGFLGTPTPATQPAYFAPNPNFIFEEDATSPSIERGEQATIVHTFHCDPVVGTTLIQGLSRGVIQQDSYGDFTRILTARMDYERAGKVRITTTSEGLNFDSPPDEFGVEVAEFNPALFRHPSFLPLLSYNVQPGTALIPINPAYSTGPQIIASIIQAANQSTVQSQNSFLANLNPGNTGNTVVTNLAQLLLSKYQQGVDTFYLAGYKVSWSSYWFLPPLLSPGGYIEDPVYSGFLPAYFWSDNGTPSGNNIFTYLAEFVDSTLYGNGISWLRLGDSIQYQRTWFKITRQWLAGPYGHWDTDIYPVE
jgi:hypothetical protein